MNKAFIRRSKHIYNFLLNFYPKAYRKKFGEEMKYVFSESLNDAYSENGEIGLISFWKNTISDSFKSIYKENLENMKGGVSMKLKNSKFFNQYKFIARPLTATLLILLIPVLGNQFIEGWNWGPIDFIVMGTLLIISGVAIETANKRIKNPSYKYIAVFLIIAVLLWLWAELAVGVFTNWGS